MTTKLSSRDIERFLEDNKKHCERCLRLNQLLAFAATDMNNAFAGIRRYPHSEKCKAKVLEMRDNLRTKREEGREHIEHGH